MFIYSAALIISVLHVTSICNLPLLPAILYIYIYIYIYDFLDDAFECIVPIFLLFLSVLLICPNLQSVIPNPYLNTGRAKAAVTLLLFLAFSSDFSMILNLLMFFFSQYFLMLYTSLPSFPRYLLVGFPCSRCVSLLISSIKFCE